MPLSELSFLAFTLLAAAICAVWLHPVRINDRLAVPPWMGFFIAAAGCGLAAGVLNLLAVAELGIFCVIAYVASKAKRKVLSCILLTIAAIVALAMAMHRLPGFNNPIVISNLKLSADAIAFTQYANFDKGAAGLILLAFLCKRADTVAEWRAVLKRTWPVGIVTVLAVLGAATLIGYIKPDVKLSQATALFLVTNLFFTVVAEEAFFRGILQDRLASSLARFRYGHLAALICSALLFGAVHAAGGGTYVLLATIAGFGYAYAYFATQRIEAPIIVHFAVNAVHFIGFTYPHLN
ncbi:CAAX amino terminal protease family protein [Collimonas arenae]|uniref:CAAX amino terminal protease family protein n=1 Tax=Collimonas arenae TaxID=279058 RepID=A0A0A1F3A7_9BURK|nr:CPBP family intramembrane glutamic endopeptidase [Collimonas arenae]AIY39218.1 CAAX amino terminal protease family protein [Collimonas arenae]